MKKLVCEICGSNDIIEQDGFFVCKACNTKYSNEKIEKDIENEETSTNSEEIKSKKKYGNIYIHIVLILIGLFYFYPVLLLNIIYFLYSYFSS